MPKALVVCIILFFLALSGASKTDKVYSSCESENIGKWNTKHVGKFILSWLKSVVSVPRKFQRKHAASALHEPKPLQETEDMSAREREISTIFQSIKEEGITWQWKSNRREEGFLYSPFLVEEGVFSGDNIVFIYPDLETGLKGIFENGQLVEAVEVNVIAERCNKGVKELQFSEPKKDQVR